MKVMRMVILCACCLIFGSTVILSITAAPKTSGVDNQGIKWNYDIESKTLTFTGKGKTAEYYDEECGVPDLSPWGEWRKVCKKVVFSEGITEIGDCYLSYFDRIKEVKLPKTLQVIQREAFDNCSSLERIEFSENLEVIEESAFSSCELNEVNLPKWVKRVGNYAFTSNDLQEVEWSDSISYGECVYSENNKVSKMTFAEGMNELPDGYMFGIHKIKKATFPKNITKIPESAFGYAKVGEVTLSSSIKK